MRIRSFLLILPFTFFLFACGGGNSGQDISGTWSLTGFSKDGNPVELTDCDLKTKWIFTDEAADPLGDGTEVSVLKAEAPSDCEYYGFDAKWTVKDGQVFVSTSRIGGMGGSSLAGMMKIVESGPNRLVLETMGKQITLEK